MGSGCLLLSNAWSSDVRCSDAGIIGSTKLLRPFSELVESAGVTDPFILQWVDLLSFLLSGIKADGTLAAEIVRFGLPPLVLSPLAQP